MQRVCTILKWPEHVGDVRVVHRLARVVSNQILLGHVSNVVGLIIFGQQVIKRLLANGTAVFGNSLVPLFRVGKLRIHVKNHPAKRVFFVADDLSQMVFCACSQHIRVAPIGHY